RPFYARAPWVHAWEGPNEPPVSSAIERAALVAFTRRWVQRMHSMRLRTIALCLGVGWPDIGDAADLAGALEDTDYWSLHEYSAPSMQSSASWFCLRYRRTVAELRAANVRIPPLLITECGIDGGCVDRPRAGWKSYAKDTDYLSQMIWYDGELQHDDYVAGAQIFTSGPNWDWMDFDMGEQLSRNLAAYIEQQRGLAAPPQPLSAFALQRPLATGVGWVLHWFGDETDDTSETGLSGHPGLDYSAPEGAEVLAAHAGSCSVGHDDGYGTYVRLTAGDQTFQTIYAHLADVTVGDGQQVGAGATLGHAGTTGKANGAGPVLHFGWQLTGVRNPAYANWLDPLLGRKLNGDA
ncbi:MAG TPA: M23 family metallopeptidase, partial [Anaerolineae bacterium]